MMPWYKCFVAGKNFPGELAGEEGNVGFYTMLFVEADNVDAVETKGMKLLKADPKLHPINQAAATEEATIYFEEIVEIPASAVPKNHGRYVWYARDSHTKGTQICAKHRIFPTFLIFYAPCILIQLIGGYFTQLSVTTWYPTLHKSTLTPPGAAFGIAWTILYFLMAVAATRVYLKRGTFRSRSLVWWMIQLLLGLIWCIVFFGNREIAAGLVIILANWAAVALTLYRFWRIDRKAGLMLAPLLAWLTFASYLNGFIWAHN